MSLRVRMEQGATIIPMVRNDPLEIGAAMSEFEMIFIALRAHVS